MRVAICDVCYYQQDKLSTGKYRMGYTNGVKLDVCPAHREFVKSCTGPQQLADKYYQMVNSRPDLRAL